MILCALGLAEIVKAMTVSVSEFGGVVRGGGRVR